jgi:hypothetical protein
MAFIRTVVTIFIFLALTKGQNNDTNAADDGAKFYHNNVKDPPVNNSFRSSGKVDGTLVVKFTQPFPQ